MRTDNLKRYASVLLQTSALALAAGCSTSSTPAGPTSGTLSTFCLEDSLALCVVYRGIDSTLQSADNSFCTSNGFTVTSSCPAAGLLGCCNVPGESNNPPLETCYYQADAGLTAAQEQTLCTTFSIDGGANTSTWSTTP
jgi:hypothetical protein